MFNRFSKTKYSNKKVELDGHSFASKLEASVFSILKNQENLGEIEILQCQDHVYLTDARILYVADFKAKDVKTGEVYWIESKGFETSDWRIKYRLWKYYGPGTLVIYRGTHLRPFVSETLKVKA